MATAVGNSASAAGPPVSGDDAVFLRAHYAELRRFAAVVSSAGQDPDDLLQEALLRSLRVRRLSDLESPVAYLRRSIINIAHNERRERERRGRAFRRVAAGNEDRPTDYPSDLADLFRLPPRDRAVLYLRGVEGMAYDEIGEVVGMTGQAARKQAQRARDLLRQVIDEESAR